MRNKFWIKTLALFTLISIVSNLFFPAVSYALTSGPVAPEYTNFEPAEATDMVDLITGDFTYNIPILDIPGPEGGYPLSLAYHAGIRTDEEASWVGLGWCLNAGAISRNVNNIPDDVNGIRRDTRSYWVGGETTERFSGFGILGNGYISDEAWDTYKGYGYGYYCSIAAPLGDLPVFINAGFGDGPYGGNYADVGYGVGYGGLKGFALGYDISSNGSASISASTLAIGVSVDNGGNTSVSTIGSTGGSSGVINNKEGQISSYTNVDDQSINLGLFDITSITRYTRYWSDVIDYVDNYGTLYFNNVNYADKNLGKNRSLDTYPMYDLRNANAVSKSPNYGLGGSLPSCDNYMVAAQGLFGYMKPYIFDNVPLFRQNQESQDDGNLAYTASGHGSKSATGSNPLNKGSKVNFRFKSDFSNFFKQDNSLKYNGPAKFVSSNIIEDISGNISESNNAIDASAKKGFDSDRDYLAGSKHIEWFSNAEITKGNAAKYGFLKYPRFDYSEFEDKLHGITYSGSYSKFADQIGGYMITNSSGATYHFALPVYAYGEYARTESVDQVHYSYRWESKKEPYAYSWLLTAVTGADYVDRGGGANGDEPNGILDDSDWGYWVQFDYGKWTDKYNWRSPGIGYEKDIDLKNNRYSYGYKQLYYLDAIRTRTHTALFIKDIRKDGNGVADFVNGTFSPTTISRNSCPDYMLSTDVGSDLDPESEINVRLYTAYPVSQLKLEEIYLLTNQQYDEYINNNFIVNNLPPQEALKRSSNFSVWSQGRKSTCLCPVADNSAGEVVEIIKDYTDIHLDINVLDVNDKKLDALKAMSIKVIDFGYTYDLCPGTPNSQNGKLTLAQLDILGKGGAKVVPSTQFDYGQLNIDGTKNTANNPAYGKDSYDMWGYYKSDINASLLAQNDNAARHVNQSDRNKVKNDVSAWSLRKVTSPFGSSMAIQYDTDVYDNVTLGNTTFRLQYFHDPHGDQAGPDKNVYPNIYAMTINPSTDKVFSVSFLDLSQDYTKLFKVGDQIQLNMAVFMDYQFWVEVEMNYARYSDYIESIFIITGVSSTQVSLSYSQDFIDKVTQLNTKHNNDNMGILYNHNDYVLGGFMVYKPLSTTMGGGHRVSEIDYNKQNRKFKTMYNYSKGTTSYEPFGLPEAYLPDIINVISSWKNAGVESMDQTHITKTTYDNLTTGMYKNYHLILANSSIIPPPGVSYGKIEVTRQVADINTEFIYIPGKPIPDFNNEISVVNIPGKTVYEFNTYKSHDDINNNTDDVVYSWSDNFSTNINSNNVHVQDFTTRIGQLKKITSYKDFEGADLLSEKSYIYLHDLYTNADGSYNNNDFINGLISNYNSQGLTEQVFHEYKYIEKDVEDPSDFDRNAFLNALSGLGGGLIIGDILGKNTLYIQQPLFVTTKLSEYPDMLIGQTVKDYKKGVTESISYKGFDFYSGVPNKTLSQLADGSYEVTQTTAAYEKYPQMGLKVNNLANKHMLMQTYAKEVFETDATGAIKSGLKAASKQTWDNNIGVMDVNGFKETNIWRQAATYSWVGSSSAVLNNDGTYPISTYVSEDLGGATSSIYNNGWLKTGEITLYDAYSHVLESKDVAGNYSAVKFDNYSEKVNMSANNARYVDIAFSGLENPLIENRERGVYTGDPSNSLNSNIEETHSGLYSLVVGSGKTGFNNTIPKESFVDSAGFKSGMKYRANVWVYMPGFSESESQAVELSYGYIDGTSIATPPVNLVSKAYPDPAHKSKSWYLLELNNIVPNSLYDLYIYVKNNSSRGVYMDDFKVQPMNAVSSAFVYDRYTNEVSYRFDNNHLYTAYQYDNAGKVVKSMKEIFYTVDKILFENKENYARKD